MIFLKGQMLNNEILMGHMPFQENHDDIYEYTCIYDYISEKSIVRMPHIANQSLPL